MQVKTHQPLSLSQGCNLFINTKEFELRCCCQVLWWYEHCEFFSLYNNFFWLNCTLTFYCFLWMINGTLTFLWMINCLLTFYCTLSLLQHVGNLSAFLHHKPTLVLQSGLILDYKLVVTSHSIWIWVEFEGWNTFTDIFNS